MEASDAELVGLVRRGDPRAADRLLERYLRACRAVALAITGNEADADDVCQDAFVAALARIEHCRDPSRFGGWLLQIVRNHARNALRHRAVRRADSLGDVEVAAPGTPAADLDRAELREQLLAALGTLPEVQREVVLLHDLEGWKHREIADRLDLPAGTVRSHLHHARQSLRKVLNLEHEDDARA
jgi:RNA polymerase sigma-70 factor, ECF subfamily